MEVAKTKLTAKQVEEIYCRMPAEMRHLFRKVFVEYEGGDPGQGLFILKDEHSIGLNIYVHSQDSKRWIVASFYDILIMHFPTIPLVQLQTTAMKILKDATGSVLSFLCSFYEQRCPFAPVLLLPYPVTAISLLTTPETTNQKSQWQAQGYEDEKRRQLMLFLLSLRSQPPGSQPHHELPFLLIYSTPDDRFLLIWFQPLLPLPFLTACTSLLHPHPTQIIHWPILDHSPQVREVVRMCNRKGCSQLGGFERVGTGPLEKEVKRQVEMRVRKEVQDRIELSMESASMDDIEGMASDLEVEIEQQLYASLYPTLKRCSSCKSIYYCSKACQKKDWQHHKPLCKLIALRAER